MKLPSSMAALTVDFRGFVEDTLPEIAATQAQLLDPLMGHGASSVVIYGFGDLGRRLMAGLGEIGITPVCIVDSRLSKTLPSVSGVPCMSAEDGCRLFGKEAVFIVSVFNQSGNHAFAAIRAGLRALGARKIIYFMPVLWRYPDIFLPYYCFDLPSKLLKSRQHLLDIYAALGDDESRVCFAFHLYQLTCPGPLFTVAATAKADTYFEPGIVRLSRQEVFLDGGAYDGVTLKRFMDRSGGVFSNYLGVEPDPANLAKLESCVDEMRPRTEGTLATRSCAVGRERGSVHFDAVGTISSAVEATGGNGLQVAVLPLSEVGADLAPTFIKLDIEGFELDALEGSVDYLQRYQPKLAICVYHRQDHFWAIPQFVVRNLPNLRVYLRRHREYLDDFVLYAVPPEHVSSH